MTAEQFAYWLNGMLEYRDISSIGIVEAQKMLKGIKDHLETVFKKVTPSVDAPKKVSVDLPKNVAHDEALRKFFEQNKLPKVSPNDVKIQPPAYMPTPYFPPPDRYWLERPSTGKPEIYC